MKTILAKLKKILADNGCAELVTVIESSGSVPRGKGAYMLVNEAGRLDGTIGGGNLEYQAILKAQQLVRIKDNYIYDYDLSNSAAAELGMVCGGRAKVLFCCFDINDIDFIDELAERFEKDMPFSLLLPISNNRAKIIEDITDGIIEYSGSAYYAESFCTDGGVYIFGGGHVAQETVGLLSHLGFSCTIIEDRKEFCTKELFPDAKAIILSDYSKIQLDIGYKDYILIMTRGHKDDKTAEKYALSTKAHYIGVIGSRTKAAYVRNALKSEGFSDNELDRVTTPVGLDIGSETPAEIAVSIAAQLIMIKRKKVSL